MVIITKALGLVYKVPLANILGGTGMGYFSAAYSLYTPVFSLAAAGIPSAMSRLAAENHALGRYKNLREQRRAAFLIFSLLSIFACGLLIAGAALLAGAGKSGIALPLAAIAPSVVFCSIINVERGYCEGLRNMLPTALSEIAETVFKLIFGLGLAVKTSQAAMAAFSAGRTFLGVSCPDPSLAAERSLPLVAAAAIAGSSLASALAGIFIIIGTRLSGDGLTPEQLKSDPVTDGMGAQMKRLLKLSLAVSASGFIVTLTGMLDMLTISPCIRLCYRRSPETFRRFLDLGVSESQLPAFMYGSYEGMAMLIFGLVPTLTAMFGKSMLPALADAKARGRQSALSSGIRDMLAVSGMIAVPLGLGMAVLAKPTLELLFPSRTAETAAAAPPLAILGIAVIFYGIALPCFTVLQTMGSPLRSAGIMAAGAAVKTALDLLLIPQPAIGLSGAAIAELISSALICALAVRELRLIGGTAVSPLKSAVRPLYAGLVCAASARLCYDTLAPHLPPTFTLLSAAASGGIMYFISLYLLCETPKKYIRGIFSKKIEKST
ncbi:MAG: polysaccharide biosynthesis C-terminal domain-containing protein [Ruminococcus sp.]|nr:polysaccharide biosynthesis C-terminal domain-containing protein [Ruminococcus sp.]